MDHYLICSNSKCRFILDRLINGKSMDGAHLVLKKCPACGGDWTSICPSCSLTLAVRLTGGVPHAACCERKAHAKARAA